MRSAISILFIAGLFAGVFLSAHPVPIGRSLDATGRILVSPFAEDQGRVLYLCGYDGPYAENRSAWIFKAMLLDAMKEEK